MEDELARRTPYQPRPGIMFERGAQGEQIILNPDITVTLVQAGTVFTFMPRLDQWEGWQRLALNALCGLAPHIQLGPVGLRMARNLQRDERDRLTDSPKSSA